MPSDDNQKPKAAFTLSVGKEIDSALADIIRGLLKRPSEELGNLMADGIGIISDRVRQKRLINAQMGLEQTRIVLEDRNVQLKDITPPSEEDVYIALEGMSVSNDENIRKLWSGLLANALDPSRNQGIDRPIASTISSLSPADACIIKYASFVNNQNRSIQLEARKAAGIEERAWLTVGEAKRIEDARIAMVGRIEDFMNSASQLETAFNLPGIAKEATWPDNLVRLGIIRSKSEEYSSKVPTLRFRGEREDGKFQAILEYLEKRFEESEALTLDGLQIEFLYRHDDSRRRVDIGFQFSRFGEQFCRACGLL